MGEDKLFPSFSSFVVFLMYMTLFIAQGILVTASRGGSKEYSYNVTSVVLLAEFTKLLAAVFLFFSTGSRFHDFIGCWRVHSVMILYYLVPSVLYAIYNNLSFLSLARFDPTTYFLLLQFRVVVTGVIYQQLFAKRLSCRQWVSLIILTLGCILKEAKKIHALSQKSGEILTTADPDPDGDWSVGILFIVIQVFSSCFAGVYNEFLLKKKGAEVNIWFQNCCLYIDSIICNIVFLTIRGTIYTAFSAEALTQLANPKVVSIIINNAAIGIVTALFLKKLNSIVKTFASALEIMFTAVLCWIIFDIPVDLFTVVAILVVSVSLAIYALNPIVQKEITSGTV